MKIAFYELEGWEKEMISKELEGNDLIFSSDIAKPTDAEIISIFINSRIDKDFIDHSKNLKMIITRSAGIDHIDVEYATQKGIIVKNCPNYSPNSVAEFSFLLLLALIRKLPIIFEQIQNFELNPILSRGITLHNKRIGIVGTGKIGSVACKIAKGFGMKVFAYDVKPKKELEQIGIKYVPLDEIWKQEIVSFYVPLTKETYHLLNMENVKKLNNAFIVNVSRGSVVDIDAIQYGLENNHIAGIAMDVIEGEKTLNICSLTELKPDDALNFAKIQKLLHKYRDRVILTPHYAYNTFESVNNIWSSTLKHIHDFINSIQINRK